MLGHPVISLLAVSGRAFWNAMMPNPITDFSPKMLRDGSTGSSPLAAP